MNNFWNQLDSQRIVFLFLLACKPSIARTSHANQQYTVFLRYGIPML